MALLNSPSSKSPIWTRDRVSSPSRSHFSPGLKLILRTQVTNPEIATFQSLSKGVYGWCISSVSTVPLISCTRIMALSSQIRHCSPFYTGYGQAHVSYTADRVTHYVQYSKNISHHRGINATPYSVHFGGTPPDISIDMSLHSIGIAGKNCLSVILAV